MLVGSAKLAITPPIGTWLVGYLDRETVSERVDAPLFARALALKDGEHDFVLISCDLLAVHPALLADVRARVEARTGVDRRSVWVVATHTHSGPPSFATGEINATERGFIEQLPERLAEVAIAAVGDLEQASLSTCTAVSSVAENRRRIVDGRAVMEPAPGRPLDREISVLMARRQDNSVKACLVVVPCHPVTVGRDNLGVGSDYPGQLCSLLEDRHGGIGLFAMASAGDVNPLDGLIPDLGGATRTAAILAKAIDDALASAQPVEGRLSETLTGEREFPVLASVVDAQHGSRPDIEHLVQLKGLDWPQIDRVMDRRHPWAPPVSGNYHLQDHVPGEIGVVRIGDLALLGLPFEVFSAVGLEIKAHSPLANTIIVSQCNGALGYLAPEEELQYGGYEIRESCLFYRTRGPLSPRATELTVSTSLDLLSEARA